MLLQHNLPHEERVIHYYSYSYFHPWTFSYAVCSQLVGDFRALNKSSFPACFTCNLHFMFSFFFHFIHAALTILFIHPLIHPFIFSSSAPLDTHCSILASAPSSNPNIYHLNHLDSYHSTSPQPSSRSSSSASSSSCWYSPSDWPSGEECRQYIQWTLVAACLLLFFSSSFLVIFSDRLTTCHCDIRHTPTQGPGPQHGVPHPSMGPTDSQCKSLSSMLERRCKQV